MIRMASELLGAKTALSELPVAKVPLGKLLGARVALARTILARVFLGGAILLVALSLAPTATAVLDEAAELRAQRLGMSLRCVVCKAETVQESPSKIAADMRRVIRSKIQNGDTDTEILEWLEQRYGDAIYLKPPLTARSYILWFLPLLFLLIGWRLAARRFKR